MNHLMKLFLIVAFGALLSACGGTGGVKPGGVPVEDHSQGAQLPSKAGQPGAEAPGASSSALPGQAGAKLDALDNPNSPLATRVFYFAYDSSEVKPSDRPIIAAHAQYLAKHPNVTVVVEGNTDERGSREYNIGLGERRAEAVRRLLLFQGATDKQIQTISYGEERPVALGHNEAAWKQNRRVELVYKRDNK
jgi:peptidoglycan-associated lipoprotein